MLRIGPLKMHFYPMLQQSLHCGDTVYLAQMSVCVCVPDKINRSIKKKKFYHSIKLMQRFGLKMLYKSSKTPLLEHRQDQMN